uniref:RIKEN cDNA 6430550D23 gene n=1 Tax=Mus spicilegus TaxID=10103 RepID=A0A8C6GE77_MUSSI
MEHCWVFWGLVLWMIAPCLDLTHELAPQQEWTYMVPQQCNWFCFKFGKRGCPSKSPNCSTCYHTAGEACYEKFMGYWRTKALWWLGMNSVSEHGTVWKKPSGVTPNSLLHHFDFHCVSCAMLGNSGFSNINQLFYMAFRMNQASNHSSETEMRSQTAGPFICPRNASHQGFWGQYWLLQLADLVPQVTRFWKMV